MYNPAIRGQQFIFYIGLPSQVDPRVMQANPTLASGDAKVAKDDDAPANLGTLPVVDGDFTKRIKVTLSASEMDANNVSVILSDVAGFEWCDVVVNIHPTGLLLAGSVNDASATTTTFISTLTGYGDDFFNGAWLSFTDGTLQNQVREISDYVSSTGTFTLTPATTSAPANSTPFIILGRKS